MAEIGEKISFKRIFCVFDGTPPSPVGRERVSQGPEGSNGREAWSCLPGRRGLSVGAVGPQNGWGMVCRTPEVEGGVSIWSEEDTRAPLSFFLFQLPFLKNIYIFLSFFFFAMPRSLWDLISLTRD